MGTLPINRRRRLILHFKNATTDARLHWFVLRAMTEYDKAQERYHECVKDLDPMLHVGGFPARAIVIEPVDGHFAIYKENLRPDKAIGLLRSLVKNAEFPWVRIHSVNQKTKTRVDTAHREG